VKSEEHYSPLFTLLLTFFILELRTVYSAALRTAYEVNHGEFKSALNDAYSTYGTSCCASKGNR